MLQWLTRDDTAELARAASLCAMCGKARGAPPESPVRSSTREIDSAMCVAHELHKG